jgi:hypothetical protein
VAVRAIHDDGVGERDVDAILDDRGGDEDIELMIHEGEQRFLKLRFTHLPVADDYTALRDEFLDLCGELVDSLHAVVNEIDLTAAFEF